MPSLLRHPPFLALFSVQFFGAFNDNLFKNALVMLITYRLMHDSDAGLTVALAAGLFILPFFLFSAWAGHLADRWDKVWLMRKIKLAEILIMLLAGFSLWRGDVTFMLVVLFLLGVQSAFFGPIKYAILPERFAPAQLMSVNAWFSGSTFIAILLGTLLGGLLILQPAGQLWLNALMLTLALLGYLASRAVALSPSPPPRHNHTLSWWALNRQLFQQFDDGRGYLVVAISAFWFIGASLLSQFPVWVKDHLHADEQVAVLFMTLFAVGFGLGAAMINSLLKGRSPLRYQSFLLLLMAVALADALWASGQVIPAAQAYTISAYLSQWPANRVLFDLFILSLLGGAYCVPLYTQLQRQVPANQRALAFALNNWMNALFMVVSALAIMLGYALALDWLDIGQFGVALIILFALVEQRWRRTLHWRDLT
jgi:acyl-[acyl-carrier-protein]-phospholipid O-acyltransferase/long-chain-fatty-acid--[acyl-carrier-protein] ligase